jgi:hypothetical protein
MAKYIIDSEKHYGLIEIDDEGIIIETIPIFQKFKGQAVENLIEWVKTHFGYCNIKEVK